MSRYIPSTQRVVNQMADQLSPDKMLKTFTPKSLRKATGKMVDMLSTKTKEEQQEHAVNRLGLNANLPEAYFYNPVLSERGQIRLLRIHPDTGYDNSGTLEPIRIELFHVHLQSKPQYTALSYTWGSPGHLPIWINGQVFHVGENLHEALRWLRSHNQPDRCLWIDAICICQRDNSEKAVQVSMMGRIYRSAQEVLVWLGHDYEAPLKVIASIGAAAEDAGVWEVGYVARKERHQLGKPILDLMLSIRTGRLPAQTSSAAALGSPNFLFDPYWTFFALPRSAWFTRVWVLQEVALARNAILASRSAMAPFSALVSALRLLDIWLDWNPRELIREQAHRRYGPLAYRDEKKMGEIREEMAYQEPPSITLWKQFSNRGTQLPPTLLECLDTIFVKGSPQIRMHATDARDRVYALLDLSRDASELGMKPDYNKPTVTLFVQLACSLMHYGDLSVLLFCRGRQLQGLPSWVPDWTADIIAPWGAHDFFSASGPPHQAKETWIPVPIAWKDLNIYAVEVGRITKRGSVWGNNPSHDMSDHAAQEVKLRFQEIKHLLNSSDRYTNDEQSSALWQIPIGNKERIDENATQLATESSYQGYLSIHKYLREFHWGHGTVGPLESPLFWEDVEARPESRSLSRQTPRSSPRIPWADENGGFPWAEEAPKQAYQRAWVMYYKAMRAMKDSRPVATSNGYVGLGPGACEHDDTVIIPMGSRTPLVVRAVADGSKHVLVGEMYAHGIMHGEFMEGESTEPRAYVLV